MADDELKPNPSPSDGEGQDQQDGSGAPAGGEDDQDVDKQPGKKSAEARINELTGKIKDLEEQVAKKETAPPPPPPPAPSNDGKLSPDDQKALDYLQSLGFTRKGEVEEKVRTIEERIALDSEHNRLVSNYDGADGRPKYEKSKVEQYMRERGVYDPEVAYKALNEAELLDWNIKKSNEGGKQKPFVDKPGGGSVNRGSENTITREKLAEVANNPTPANREWYERNRLKILDLMAKGQL